MKMTLPLSTSLLQSSTRVRWTSRINCANAFIVHFTSTTNPQRRRRYSSYGFPTQRVQQQWPSVGSVQVQYGAPFTVSGGSPFLLFYSTNVQHDDDSDYNNDTSSSIDIDGQMVRRMDDFDDGYNDDDVRRRSVLLPSEQQLLLLSDLQDEIRRLNGGIDLNVNSPKQVSMAIFGTTQQTVTRRVLNRIVGDINNNNKNNKKDNFNQVDKNVDIVVPYEKQRLAQLILQCRDILQKERSNTVGPEQRSEVEKDNEVHDGDNDGVLTSVANDDNDIGNDDDVREAVDDIVGPFTTTRMPSVTGVQIRSQQPRDRSDRLSLSRPLSHEEVVQSLFASPKCRLDPYWKQPLLELTRPTARELLAQLDAELCPMGFDPDATPRKSLLTSSGLSSSSSSSRTITSTKGRKGTFLEYYRSQKESYPQCIILARCGDFYETYGIDAVLLVEYVGLNPMGGKVKAGCPYRNIQSTVDGLTQQGFSVAVYEEVGQVAGNKLKTRVLTQIVSPASPTYLYDNWLLAGGGATAGGGGGSTDQYHHHMSLDGLPPSRPCVGVVLTAAGYNIVEVSLEERSVQYSERLTPEAVACRLAAYPPADPLVYIPSPFEQQQARLANSNSRIVPSFLPNSRWSGDGVIESNLGGSRIRTKILRPQFVPDARPGLTDADRYIQAIVETLLEINEKHAEDTADSRKRVTVDDFTKSMTSTATNPLYVETATQVGLMKDPTIPSLIQHILDDAAPSVCRRFLQRYLLVPPPPSVAQAMAKLIGTLTSPAHVVSLPPLIVPNLGKVLSLIRAEQAGVNVYAELLQSLATTMYILDGLRQLPSDAILHLCEHESGLPAKRLSVLERCHAAIRAIEAVVSSDYHVFGGDCGCTGEDRWDDRIFDDEYVPPAFFERNEASWRGRVQPRVAKTAYQRVHDAAHRLCEAVKEDFIVRNDNNKAYIVQDIFNNLIVLREKPKGVHTIGADQSYTYFHPKDRNGKILSSRWTTHKVQQALSDYVCACEIATEEVSTILSNLARTLQDGGHIPAIAQSSHLNLILCTAFHHAVKASRSQWQLAKTVEGDDDAKAGAHFVDVFPYWMSKSKAVSNTFDLSSMILLTAPNMSGKSTIMRSTAAASLLTVCGLCAPLAAESTIPRFDSLFVRGASADVPTEDKSAFGAEMGDISALFRCCGPKSLVFVDELGRGTSPRDGTRLAGAVLEAMSERGMCGIFATHLHDIIDLPLKGRDRIVTKRMTMLGDGVDNGTPFEWTYKLEDGYCTNSLALVTAERFGLPEEIIRRANELAEFLPDRSRTIDVDDLDKLSGNSNDDDEAPTAGTTIPSQARDRSLGTINGRRNQEENDANFKKVIAKASAVTGKAPISIPAGWTASPSLAAQSCVYVLELNEDPPRYYVGETDSVVQRLRQHDKKGGSWRRSRAVILPVEDKTQARYYESLLIQELAQSGFRLASTADGRSLRRPSKG